MKKLYYFSKSKLQFIEVRKYRSKLVFFFLIAVIIVSFGIAGGYYYITSITDPWHNISKIERENSVLKNKLSRIFGEYKVLNTELDSLSKVNNNLILAVNLPPLSAGERKVGIGGGSFDNSLDFLNGNFELKLKETFSYVNEVSRKIAFEKSEYKMISKKLLENRKLYAAIPAIRPCLGPISDGFGMRMHPILHIRRMHEGIDIVTAIGTPIHATGNGKIAFTGRKGGFGLVVEINHGFGYRTVYAHLSKILVHEGQKVIRGQVIAKSGSSGLSTGPHLHYEVHHNGVKLNPANFFFGDLGFFELTSKN